MYSSHGGEKYFSIASERSFSTLGYERRNNPSLRQTSRDAFIALKTHEHAFFPPRCNLTLRLNLEGPPLMNGLPRPQPYTAEDFAALMEMGMYVVDTRSPEAVCGNYIPGTLAIPLRRLPLFAGWFIPPDHPIGLIVGESSQVDTAVRHLVRIGFESIPAYLASEAFTWKAKGKTGESIPVVSLSEIEARRHNEARPTIIDVRTGAEYDRGHLDGAIHIFAGEIPERIETIPGDRSVIVYSGNGDLAVIAATLLRLHGIQDTGVGFGPLRT
jgi:hydroxyacylglutathione hydrolase